MAESIFIIITLSACAHHQGYPMHLVGVENFARGIDPGLKDFPDKQWLEVLKRQPIKGTSKRPTYKDIKAINDDCNNKPYKKHSPWLTPKEFKASETSDCKSFAVCKYYALRKAGFKPNQLNLWSGDYDRRPHLILAVTLDNKQYVLDIGAEANLPEARDYFYKRFQPAYRFNEIGWDVN